MKEISGFCKMDGDFVYFHIEYENDEDVLNTRQLSANDILDYSEEPKEIIDYLGGKIYTKVEEKDNQVILSEPVDLHQFIKED